MQSQRKGLYDPAFFATYWLGIKLNPFQERVLEEMRKALWDGEYKPEDLIEMLLDAGNRTGKTVLIAIIHIYFAFYKIGISFGQGYEEFRYRTFDISPQSRQAKECLKYIQEILEGRLTWEENGKRHSNSTTLKLKGLYEGKNEATGELRYTNRSVTYAFSTGEDQGAGFAGLPAGVVTYDECVLSHHLEDELEANVYSRLGDYGKLMMLVATPNEEGKSQQYYYHLIAQADTGDNNYIVVHGSYLENIFISEAKRESHAQTLRERDPVMARQILFGEFVSTGGAMFETTVIEHMWDGTKAPDGFRKPVDGREYWIFVDWGFADKGDETVMLVVDLTFPPPCKICYAYARQGGDPYELMATLRNLKIAYNDATIAMDTTAMGGAMLKKMLKDLKPVSFEAAGEGNKLKTDALMHAQLVMTKFRDRRIDKDGRIEEVNPNYGWIKSPYLPKLATQLATYKIKDKDLKQDWVSAFYMACHFIWKKFGDKTPGHKKTYNIHRFRVRTPKLTLL